MPLDWHGLMPQIESMASNLKAAAEERHNHLQVALETLRKSNIDELQSKISASHTTWLVAEPMEAITNVYDPISLPENYSVVAADGSQIDVDRHNIAHCILFNLGGISLQYGTLPQAELFSRPILCSAQDDMVISDPSGGSRQEPIQGPLLGLKRMVAECEMLVELLERTPDKYPVIGLLDGSLILWALARQTYDNFVREAILDRGLLPLFDRMRKLSLKRNLAIASYISFTGSTDVVGILKVAICPFQPADCDRNCENKEHPTDKKTCDEVSVLRDRDLFCRVLKPGQRSALFVSKSSILKNYGEHQICFFYLCLEQEIARVELPLWVARNKMALELVHSLILEKCRKGQGYPVSLGEAHEQAVVTNADRDQFWKMVQASFIEKHMPEQISAKSHSKRTRWL